MDSQTPASDGRGTRTDAAPPVGRHYEVGDRRLMLHRSGTGRPAVVFLPGAGLVGVEFLNVQDEASRFTTSVLYDRGGTGWSDPVVLPRSATAAADELRQVLRAAGVPGPYLLAGHSMGALYARRYAQLFPDEVAGLLLLDPGHEDMFDYLPKQLAELNEQHKPDPDQMPDLTDEQRQAARSALAQLYANWPPAILEPLIEHRLLAWRTGLREAANLESEVYPELRSGGPLPDVPLIVLTAGGPNPYLAKVLTPELLREAAQGISALHRSVARSVPRGEHRVLDDATHQSLHVEHPEAVIQAIRDLLDRISARP